MSASPEPQGGLRGRCASLSPRPAPRWRYYDPRPSIRADFVEDPLGPRYRLRGNKMWISGGEHELRENIVHLVLAKIPARRQVRPGARASRCSSCRSASSTTNGALTGERNDVALAGLNHKMGYRGTTNTLLNFGEGVRSRAGGDAGRRSAISSATTRRAALHVPHDERGPHRRRPRARPRSATPATEASLDYARTRPQGRPSARGGKDPTQPQVPIIEHADVRRMLLAQKTYVRGRVGAGAVLRAPGRRAAHRRRGRARAEARLAARGAHPDRQELAVTSGAWRPTAWRSRCSAATATRATSTVEQHYRDNRLNPIHEGTHGIQALDLFGRKVDHDGGAGLAAGRHAIRQPRLAPAARPWPTRRAAGIAGAQVEPRPARVWSDGDPDGRWRTPRAYLRGLRPRGAGLDLAGRGAAAAAVGGAMGAGLRPVAAMRFFFDYELPKIDAWLVVVARREALCRDLDPSVL